jgi:hypothetical protein
MNASWQIFRLNVAMSVFQRVRIAIAEMFEYAQGDHISGAAVTLDPFSHSDAVDR